MRTFPLRVEYYYILRNAYLILYIRDEGVEIVRRAPIQTPLVYIIAVKTTLLVYKTIVKKIPGITLTPKKRE